MTTRKIWLYIPILGYSFLSGCGIFGGTQNSPGGSDYTTIPLPPQKLTASNANADQAKPGQERAKTLPVTASGPAKRNASQTTYINTYPQRIQEDRSNGTVTEIKVDNKDLPDYYMYPQQRDAPVNNSNNISTPSWQISW